VRAKHPDGRSGDLASLWQEYERRHRVFLLAFGRQHSLFVTLTRGHFKRVEEEKGESL
jgi:hypothetical protein